MEHEIHAILGELIPIVSIVLGIGMVIVTIVTRHHRDMHRLELQHRERMAAIEKGLELPPEPTVVTPEVVRHTLNRSGSRYLLRGLVWLGVGLAITFAETGWDRWHSYGWIGVAVGVAYLVFYALEGRKEVAQSQDGQRSVRSKDTPPD